MKKLETYVREERFAEIHEELRMASVGGLTFVKSYEPEYLDRLKLEMIVRDMDVEKVVGAIARMSPTFSSWDSKVFLSPVEQVFDIASGQTGDRAI